MNKDFSNILSIEFLPLSEVKAKLSEVINTSLTQSKRIAITTNGRPTAILLSYSDYLSLLNSLPSEISAPSDNPIKIIKIEEWRKGHSQRKKVRDSITHLFDIRKLSRKGQKSYKKEAVRDFKG